MRIPLVPALMFSIVGAGLAQTRPAPAISHVPAAAVELFDGFWQQRLAINREVTIPHIMRQNEETGRVANFARAARRATGAYQGRRFNDTDVYKAIEAASYTLRRHPNPALDKQLDDLIALIAAAQESDGYLYPARTIDPKEPAPGAGPARWVHLNGSHELYNAGHLYEAAVAHFGNTGKRTLLDVAIKNANLVGSVFGPGKRRAVPGHQEIELALVRLGEASGNPRIPSSPSGFSTSAAGSTRPSRTPTARLRCTTTANTGRIIGRSSNRIARLVTPCARPTCTPAWPTSRSASIARRIAPRSSAVRRRHRQAPVRHRRYRRPQRHRVVRRRLRAAESNRATPKHVRRSVSNSGQCGCSG